MNAKLVIDNNDKLVLFQCPVDGPGHNLHNPHDWVGVAVLMDGSGNGYLTDESVEHHGHVGPCIGWFGPGERHASASDALAACIHDAVRTDSQDCRFSGVKR